MVGVDDVEGITSSRSTVQSKYQSRSSRTSLGHTLVALVEHGLDAAVVRTSQHDVAYAQGAVAYQHGSHVTTAFIQTRLDDATRSLTVGVGLQLQHLGFEQYLLHQIVDTDTLLGRDVLTLVLTAPLFNEEVHVGQLFLDFVGIGCGFINLVDGEYNGYTSSHGVVDGFLGLGHHVVIGSHNDDSNVGHLGTTGTHGGEGLVTRCIQEGDDTSVFERHVVCADVLGDTSGLARDDVGLADVVEQGGLTVIDVSHYGDNRSAGLQVFFSILFFYDSLCHLSADVLRLEAKLFGYQVDGLRIQALVDRYHDAYAHTGSDDLRYRDVHHRGQLVGGNKFGNLKHFALGHFALLHLLVALGSHFTLLLAVLRGFALGSFRGEASQGLLYLTCNILLVHFAYDGLLLLLAALFVALTLFFALVAVATLTTLVAAVIAVAAR